MILPPNFKLLPTPLVTQGFQTWTSTVFCDSTREVDWCTSVRKFHLKKHAPSVLLRNETRIIKTLTSWSERARVTTPIYLKKARDSSLTLFSFSLACYCAKVLLSNSNIAASWKTVYACFTCVMPISWLEIVRKSAFVAHSYLPWRFCCSSSGLRRRLTRGHLDSFSFYYLFHHGDFVFSVHCIRWWCFLGLPVATC